MYFEAEQKGAIFGEMVEVNGECNFFRYLHYFSGDNLSAKVKLCHIVSCFHRRACGDGMSFVSPKYVEVEYISENKTAYSFRGATYKEIKE